MVLPVARILPPVRQPDSEARSYGRAAAILAVALGLTGLLTFAFFSAASHTLDAHAYKRIVLLWSVMFIVISTIYRPIEQLLSRTIAARAASGLRDHPLLVPAAIQAGFGVVFVAVAFAARGPIQDQVFDGSAALFWALVAGTTTYGVAFFARGWLGGHKRFLTLSALVFVDAAARLAFPLAVAAGLGGESLVAAGVAAAPAISLLVIPLAGRRRGGSPLAPAAEAALEGPGAEGAEEALADVTLTRGAGFAIAVLGIMAAEQALLNVPVITVDALAAHAALAGFVFNVLLIARAPLQLFQAVQIALLPHLAGLEATAGRAAFRRAVLVTALAIGAFSLAVTAGLAAIGPSVMHAVFGGSFHYARGGLALMGLGMGFHLLAGTLNQAALARDRAGVAAACWLVAGAGFVGWLLAPAVDDQILRVEVGYCGATALLCVLLAVTRRPRRARGTP
jgi:O-antigen/teichoic acid export membrane protein